MQVLPYQDSGEKAQWSLAMLKMTAQMLGIDARILALPLYGETRIPYRYDTAIVKQRFRGIKIVVVNHGAQ